MPGPDYALHPDGWLETETASFTRGAAIVFGGLVYLFDGVAGEIYDPDADAFSPLPSNGGAFGFYVAAAVVGTVAYVFVATGYNGDHQTLIDVHRLDLTTDSWLADGTTLARGVQDDLGCAAIGTDIYLPGIMDDGAPGLGDYQQLALWEYDTVGDAWTKRANASLKGVSSSVLGLVDGLLHVFGGYFSDVGNHLADHQIWNPGTDSWTAGTSLPDTRSTTNCAVMDGEVFLSGFRRGSSDSNFRDDLIFNLDDDAWRVGAAARGHTDRPVVALDDGLHVFAAGTSFQRHDFLSTLSEPEPEPEPEIEGTGQDIEMVGATVEHVIVNQRGDCIYPIVGTWEARDISGGGWESMKGRIAEEVTKQHPNILVDGADWLVFARETGEILFSGELKEPAITGGALDVSASGPASLARREISRLLYRSDGPALWSSEADELYSFRPTQAPRTGAVITGQAVGMEGGTYKWAVTFVGPEGEGSLGPAVELALDPLGPVEYHVHIKDIPRGPDGTTARRLYRLDPTAPSWGLVVQINDNTTETVLDNNGDGALGAAPPTTKETAAITTRSEKGALIIEVPADGFVTDDQFAGFVFFAPTADLTRLDFTAQPNRSLPDWELTILSSDGIRGSLTEEQVVDLTGEESFEVTEDDVETGVDCLRFRLRRKTSGADTEPVEIRFEGLRVYGAADEEDFSASDIVSDVFARIGVNDTLVNESGPSVLPQDFAITPLSEPLDLMAIIAGWRWLLSRRNLRVLGDFRDYDTKVWTLVDEEADIDLLPLQRYSRSRVPFKFSNGVATEYAEATADPNLLGFIRTAPPLPLERPGAEATAEALAQALVDFYVRQRVSGTLTMFRVRDEKGAMFSAHYVRAGHQVIVPNFPVPLNIDHLEHDENSVTVSFPDTIPLIDQYNERKLRRQAIS